MLQAGGQGGQGPAAQTAIRHTRLVPNTILTNDDLDRPEPRGALFFRMQDP